MNDPIRFWVPGVPAPGGSKRGFVHRQTGKVIVTEDCARSKDWRATVRLFANQRFEAPLRGPVRLEIRFCIARPKGHFGTGRNAGVVKPNAPKTPTTKPDCTKLLRSTEDALKGIAWIDDSQVVTQTVTKRYESKPGAYIVVQEETCLI